MADTARGRILFVTGTDTGVGKTVVTGLLLAHARARGADALAAKPFCSGGREDARLLWELQDRAAAIDEINPYSFAAPLAPRMAARREGKWVRMRDAAGQLRQLARRCSLLLVEGAGGLLVPLTEDGSVLDLVRALRCEVVVVAANKLGTINHTLLTLHALRAAGIGIGRVKVALVEMRRPDDSAATNADALREAMGRVPLVRIPWLGKGPLRAGRIRKAAGELAAELAELAG